MTLYNNIIANIHKHYSILRLEDIELMTSETPNVISQKKTRLVNCGMLKRLNLIINLAVKNKRCKEL